MPVVFASACLMHGFVFSCNAVSSSHQPRCHLVSCSLPALSLSSYFDRVIRFVYGMSGDRDGANILNNHTRDVIDHVIVPISYLLYMCKSSGIIEVSSRESYDGTGGVTTDPYIDAYYDVSTDDAA